jgi:hypothetical protein
LKSSEDGTAQLFLFNNKIGFNMVVKRISKAAVLCIFFLVFAYPVLASRGFQLVKVQGDEW